MTRQRRSSPPTPEPPPASERRGAKNRAAPPAPAAPPKSPRRGARTPAPPLPAAPPRRRRIRWALAAAVALAVLATLLLGDQLSLPGGGAAAQAINDPHAPLAPFYTAEVLRWRDRIEGWARQYHVNPNVLAIVIQIESCGDPAVISPAGALGLMQVMPFHFPNGVNMINPDSNVQQGMIVFEECLTVFADWDLGLALACYNGGPSVTTRERATWAAETQHYYRWATGLWDDVKAGSERSATLDEWLAAGGANLCRAVESN